MDGMQHAPPSPTRLKSFLALSTALLTVGSSLAAESDKKPLKVVFMMGQSNMVGYCGATTAWYLTQPIYAPPVKLATVHGPYLNWEEFYWAGIRFASGDSAEYNARGKALLEERDASRKLWRDRVFSNFSREAKAAGKKVEWNEKEWGKPPHELEAAKGVNKNKLFLDMKADEEGIYKRMIEHIESPENKLHPKVAIELMAKRDEPIAEDLKQVREIFLKGTKPEDFDRLNEELKAKVAKDKDFIANNREAFAQMLQEHVNLPIAQRTRISAFGAVTGEDTDYAPFNKVTHGVLSFGYGKSVNTCGPEYPFGISFERMVDGPVLIIKCAWGGTSLYGDWRPPSIATTEQPTGERWRWSMEHIQKVLADPGKYHPDYDPKAGVELAGLVWFQGWNDMGNAEYGEQLVSFIKDFRKEVKAPKLPVVCGLLGHAGWEINTFDGDVNSGMLYAAKHPDLKGTVDVVNTVKYMPIELGLDKSIKAAFGADSEETKKAESILSRATSYGGATHYYGSAKFMFPAGNAMARSLANLISGGEPTIHQEAERIRNTR